VTGRENEAAASIAATCAGHLLAIVLFALIFLMQGQDERDAQSAEAFISAMARQTDQGAAK
jgi:hypothetical protein